MHALPLQISILLVINNVILTRKAPTVEESEPSRKLVAQCKCSIGDDRSWRPGRRRMVPSWLVSFYQVVMTPDPYETCIVKSWFNEVYVQSPSFQNYCNRLANCLL